MLDSSKLMLIDNHSHFLVSFCVEQKAATFFIIARNQQKTAPYFWGVFRVFNQGERGWKS